MKKTAGKISTAMLERMRVPKRHWHATLAAIPEKCRHKQVIVDWVADVQANVRKAHGLLLLGSYGTGKSAIAAIMLKAAAAYGQIGLWVRTRELAKFIVEKTVFDEDATMIQRAQRVPLLVIDEVLIHEKWTYSAEAVEMLVRQRVDDELCTVLTTNHDRKTLEQKHTALMSVLREAVRPTNVAGHDFREAKATELITNVR